MLGFLKKALQTVYAQFTTKVRVLFGKESIDESSLADLEKILISADTGIHTTRTIIAHVRQDILQGKISKGTDLETALAQQLKALLLTHPFNPEADVYLLVGINGSGKTTFAGKLALWLTNQRRKILLVAADTFRAAAQEQLGAWGERLGINVVIGKENQDPASVIFQGCEQFKGNAYDVLIIDTAGRLQTKVNLMKELEKMRKIITKQLGEKGSDAFDYRCNAWAKFL